MPGEPVTEPVDEEELGFQETVDQSEYWEFDPNCLFEKNETVTIPKNIARFLWNISGCCTDPSDKGLYNNRKAMFEALDIIYKALDEAIHDNQTDHKEESARKEP
jgi:hypothetical protein